MPGVLEALPAGVAAIRAELARRQLAAKRATGVGYEVLFPAEGEYSREKYPRHLEFFAAGAQHRERVLLAANRVGKTLAGAYEMALHTTGDYPDWWQGRRFTHPVRAWACGDTSKTVRDIVQSTLVGPPHDPGLGVFPPDRILRQTPKAGVPDAIETILVRHTSGGTSELQLKSYDQKREAFQGTATHSVWLDEEPPEDIYTECLLRTAETSTFSGGMVFCTFTPLMGMTPLILSFLETTHGQTQ